MMKEPIKVVSVYGSDEVLGIYEGQVFNDYRVDDDGDYVVQHNGMDVVLLARQVDLVEIKVEGDDKPFRDALSEIGRRIREHEQKIDQLKAIGEAIKKLREEG